MMEADEMAYDDDDDDGKDDYKNELKGYKDNILNDDGKHHKHERGWDAAE